MRQQGSPPELSEHVVSGPKTVHKGSRRQTVIRKNENQAHDSFTFKWALPAFSPYCLLGHVVLLSCFSYTVPACKESFALLHTVVTQPTEFEEGLEYPATLGSLALSFIFTLQCCRDTSLTLSQTIAKCLASSYRAHYLAQSHSPLFNRQRGYSRRPNVRRSFVHCAIDPWYITAVSQ